MGQNQKERALVLLGGNGAGLVYATDFSLRAFTDGNVMLAAWSAPIAASFLAGLWAAWVCLGLAGSTDKDEQATHDRMEQLSVWFFTVMVGLNIFFLMFIDLIGPWAMKLVSVYE